MARQRVDFTTINNPLLKFLLDDGTELAVQVVLFDVVRTDEKLPDGQFKHEFRMQTMVDQIAPAGEIDIGKLTGNKS